MNILDGKKLGAVILERVREVVQTLSEQPCFGVILVGDDVASHLYVHLKEEACQRTGILFKKRVFSSRAEKSEILDCIREWNQDTSVHGILLQIPLPVSLRGDTDTFIEAMDPGKDVDGFHRVNTDHFLMGDTSGVYPVFPRAILELILSAQQRMQGKRTAIVCNSMRFGDMMREALRREEVVSEIILQNEVSAKKSLLAHSDIVVTACGVPGLITGDMIRPGAIVIDGGIVRDNAGAIVGDVDRTSMENVAGWLSPVPGGVGPVTVACLLRNVVELSKK